MKTVRNKIQPLYRIRIIQLLLIVFKIAKINENNTTETYQILIFVKIDQR